MNNSLMTIDVIFILVAFVALVFASISDIKTREIPNWLTYSLITIGFSLRFIYSTVSNSWNFFLYAVLSFSAFYILASMIYYTRQWGGGDAKLMLGLAAMFATSPLSNIKENIPSLPSLPFILNLFINIIIIGAVYSLIISIFLALKNKKAFMYEIKKLNKEENTKTIKIVSIFTTIIALLLVILFINLHPLKTILLSLILSAQLLIYLYFITKAIEYACMQKCVPTTKLTEGEWVVGIYKKKSFIEKKFESTKEKITKLRNQGIKKVKIKYGIPFAPSFLLAFIATLFYGNLLYLLV